MPSFPASYRFASHHFNLYVKGMQTHARTSTPSAPQACLTDRTEGGITILSRKHKAEQN